MQRAVEYKANSLSAFALAKLRLEQALADKNWTGAPAEQTGAYQDLPPAVVLDLDETLLDNSRFQAWMVLNDQTFSPPVWTKFVNAQVTEAIPGAVDFAKFAESKGVKVFYISNRTAEEEGFDTQECGAPRFPDGRQRRHIPDDQGSPGMDLGEGLAARLRRQGLSRAAQSRRQFRRFVDSYRTSEEERLKIFEANKERWGREWIMLANPAYGSIESAPFGHDYKKSADEQRKAKRSVLQSWSGP